MSVSGCPHEKIGYRCTCVVTDLHIIVVAESFAVLVICQAVFLSYFILYFIVIKHEVVFPARIQNIFLSVGHLFKRYLRDIRLTYLDDRLLRFRWFILWYFALIFSFIKFFLLDHVSGYDSSLKNNTDSPYYHCT